MSIVGGTRSFGRSVIVFFSSTPMASTLNWNPAIDNKYRLEIDPGFTLWSDFRKRLYDKYMALNAPN
jgi:hypothetical protein